MKTITAVGFVMAVMAAGGMASAVDSVPVTLVNYSTRPVFATAVSLDAAELWGKLGVAVNTPLRLRAVDNSGTVPPCALELQEGRPVLRLYAGLPPGKRLDLVVERADRWPTRGSAAALCFAPEKGDGEIRNGLIRVTFEKGRWALGYDTTLAGTVAPIQLQGRKKNPAGWDASAPVLIEDGNTDFWIDTTRHGRLANENPETLGLDPFSRSSLVKSEAFVGEDGRPTFRIERRMTGLAKAMTVIESYELIPGMPVMVYRINWKNEGSKPLWVAYVASGDGVKGRWSHALMPSPVVERMKSPILGAINGAETRPNWLGALCRVSVESPATGCGVGLSTLLPNGPVGQGSMIWSVGATGFQCNFIDPVQGQFPFLVKEHDGLDNGFAFLACSTDVSVFRQTHELWKMLQKGKVPDLPPACEVFVDGKPLHAQTVNGLVDSTGALRQAAVRLDFNKNFECRVDVAEAPVEILAQRLAGAGKPVVLLRADKPGAYAADLNKPFPQKNETEILLTVKTSGDARLRSLAIAETLPEAPVMLSPVADAEITDWAAMFRWKAIPLVFDYRLQLSRTPDFAAPVEISVRSSANSPLYMAPDDKLPAPGAWYWRIRGEKGALLGKWSEVRRFDVNSDHSRRTLRRPLTADKPLFTLEATWVSDFTRFNPDIPADIAPNMGIITEGVERLAVPMSDFARGMDKLPCGILLRTHDLALSDIEWMFQHVPNVIGMQGGERLGELYNDAESMRYRHRAIKLCAKYGMFHQEADGTYKDDKWQLMMDRHGAFIREYGPWLVLSQKNNIIRRQFYSQSCAMGLWLGGITHQHGAWEDGGFYWQNAGFNGLGVCQGERSGVLGTMPRIFWALNALMGISRGCGIYSLDGQTLMGSEIRVARDPKSDWASGIWYDSGRTTDTFKRFVVPLIRAAVVHRLVPTKEEVLANIKLAVYNDKTSPGDLEKWPHYVEYGPLYAATYGFRKMGAYDGQLWEFFPNTGRYYFIPVLPQGNESLGKTIRNVPVSELQDTEKVKSVFDAAYPQWYEGDAWACRIGDTLTIQNSRENEDVTESYSIPLTGSSFPLLKGTVGPHAYLVGKLEKRGKRLWLQANTEFPERDTVLVVTCSSKPECVVEPGGAAVEMRWDAATKTLNLRLSHKHGAVEAVIK
jgi:hypothetical protein